MSYTAHMQNRTLRNAALLAVAVVTTTGFVSAARAQLDPMDPGSLARHAVARGAPNMAQPEVVPPPAVPGAASNADAVAPASRPAMDMSPNDALFDAINRGDIVAARDALNRGADLGAQNVLGMTPMELSVDLGRNDISFLLLSYRPVDSPPPGQAVAATQAAPPKVSAKSQGRSQSRARVIPVKAVVAPVSDAPHLFANNGGAPVPGAGFLGFDAGRSDH
jgi:hypothetical protein